MTVQQNRSIYIGVFIFVLAIVTACVDEYWPELDQKYMNKLVVDGMITNNPGPYTIKLSLSSKVDKPELTPLTGHHVIIMDNQGNEELLIETEAGKYLTSDSGISGVVGRQYKLFIRAPSGKSYESDYAELKAPVEIKSIYSELEYRTYDHLYYEQAGYQFYIDTYKAIEDTSYLLWVLTETYKYNADYLIRWKFGPTFDQVFNSDTLFTCWKTEKVDQIFTYDTRHLSEPRIERYPLHYRTTDTRHLSIRYSLHVQQITIDEETYVFWNRLNELQEQEGLYTRQPFQIIGNIRSISNPDEAVLGYFIVAGISEKRIFQDRPTGVKFHYYECVLNEGDYKRMEWLFMTPPSFWPQYVTENSEFRKALPHQDCIDCTRKGGSLIKPEFWTDQ
ncbi:MAG: DUF4249 domain-containing protein [Bacteroidales bacterium]|nr:DUF4249 domain-containing protein [Bacteroidales bacterium]